MGPRLVLLLSVLALVLLGLVMVYSTSSVNAIEGGLSVTYYIVRQLAFTLIGAFLAVLAWRVFPYYVWFGKPLWIAYVAACLLLLLTAAYGTANYGATRWLEIGPFSLQPSEFAKIVFLLMTARIVTQYVEGEIELRSALIQGVVLVLVVVVILVLKVQSDLGTTAIIMVGVFAVMWIGGISWKILLGVALAGLIGVIFLIAGTDYRADRMVYLDPWNDGQGGYGAGYNIIRSYYAIAEGGVLGVGLGNSHEKFQYLFASESDFIFAILCEELGMVGALIVIALFIAFLVAGLRISASAPDLFGKLVAGGCTTMIAFQAFLNIGCVIGVLPTTGKPLPFISSGGSSMMSVMIMVGLILGVSRATEEAHDVYEDRRADFRLVHSDGRPFAYEGVEVSEGVSYRDDSLGRSRGASRGRGGRRADTSESRGKRGGYDDFSRIEMPRSTRR